jgi:hypothetical protein
LLIHSEEVLDRFEFDVSSLPSAVWAQGAIAYSASL